MDQFAILEGRVRTGPIYFLPWRTGSGLAQMVGLIPNSAFAACYRLPDDAARISDMVDIAVRRARSHDMPRAVVGYSMVTVPATLVAAALGTPLWSFASADRGDLMIWSSPAARTVQRDAERMGFSRNDFTLALRNLNPIDSIERVHRDSRIVVGRFDRLIPRARSQALAERARRYLPTEHVLELPLGHLGVLALSPWMQRGWMAG
jgi:pimeloyl-ACP methyl ester carboxylesterase